MTCISLALLEAGGADDRFRRMLEESPYVTDFLLDTAGADFLLATSEDELRFKGVAPVQMKISERESEDLISLIAEKGVDYSRPAYRMYCDPDNTAGLVDDARIADGFIVKAGAAYDTPEDDYRVLRALKHGAVITAVHRRGGEPSMACDNRLLLTRCGLYHPKTEDILRPFKAKGRGVVKLHTLSFSIRGGRITVDNTFRPKTVRLKTE